jgi:hypothetical protein
MPLRKDSMATLLNENFAQAYTKEESIARVAASDQASGRQRQAEDCAAIAGVTFAEPASEKSNSNAYYFEERRMNVQHFLQATSVIIGKRRYCL